MRPQMIKGKTEKGSLCVYKDTIATIYVYSL
jgi:hypothetical protein